MLKIDRHTTLQEFAPYESYVSESEMARLKDAAVADKFGEAGFYAMTIGDLTSVVAGDLRPLYDSGGRTVFDAARVKAFETFIDEFVKVLNGLTIPPTVEGIKAQMGTKQHTFSEGLYVFCRDYFGLKSFAEADGLKVSEYVLARKDDFNRCMVERNAAMMMKGGKA